MSNVRDLGVVLVHLTYLVIMCVGTRLHGILYPMTGCVLYCTWTDYRVGDMAWVC